MERTILSVPAMYADHHVTRVKDALSGLSGVVEVTASAAFKEVIVGYEPSSVSVKDLTAALEEAGYPVQDEKAMSESEVKESDPAWKALGLRVTTTNPTDLEMSGEFRRY